MRMRIYQIDMAQMENRNGIKPLDEHGKIDPTKYKKVLDAEVDEESLLGAYYLFNTVDPHPLFSGHAMTEGDVIATEEGAFAWNSKLGFQKIDFDESKANTEGRIKVLFVQPHEKPYVAEIPNTLEAKQRAVGGLIEFIYNHDGTALVGDEEAKIKYKEGNRYLDGMGIIAGNFLVVGLTEEDCRSLTDEELQRYQEKYDEAPDISPEETEADVGFTMIQFM